MASVIQAGTASNTALTLSSDTSGELQLKTNSGSTTALTLTTGGNINIPTTGARITGDFSTNSPITDQIFIQTSTTNGSTRFCAIPNGTAVISSFDVFNNSTPTNAARGRLLVNSTDMRIDSAITGTGTYLPLTMYTNGSERLRIDTSGKIGINGTPQTGVSAQVEVLQVLGTDGATSTAAVKRYSADTGSPNLRTYKSRSSSIGTDTIVQSGDGVGGWTGYGYDGSAYINCAQVLMSVDGTPGTNDMPGRIVFSTTPDGSNVITERMRITSGGNVGIGTSSPTQALDIVRSAANAYLRTTDGTIDVVYGTSNGAGGGLLGTLSNHPQLFFTYNAERMRITSGGDLLVGLTGASGRVTIRGETSDSTKYTLFTEAQDGTDQLAVRCDGAVYMGLDGASPYNLTTATAANATLLSDGFFYRSTSSIKYKKDVEDATHGLAEVMQLRPVTYKGKSAADGDKVFGGLIAEEVDAIGLTEFVQYAEDGSPDALAYGHMVSLLAKAIQELKAELDSVKAELNQLKGA